MLAPPPAAHASPCDIVRSSRRSQHHHAHMHDSTGGATTGMGAGRQARTGGKGTGLATADPAASDAVSRESPIVAARKHASWNNHPLCTLQRATTAQTLPPPARRRHRRAECDRGMARSWRVAGLAQGSGSLSPPRHTTAQTQAPRLGHNDGTAATTRRAEALIRATVAGLLLGRGQQSSSRQFFVGICFRRGPQSGVNDTAHSGIRRRVIAHSRHSTARVVV